MLFTRVFKTICLVRRFTALHRYMVTAINCTGKILSSLITAVTYNQKVVDACLSLSCTLIKFHGGRLKTAYYERVTLGILGFVTAPEALWSSTSLKPLGDVLSLSSCDIGGWKDASDRGCLLMKSRFDVHTATAYGKPGCDHYGFIDALETLKVTSKEMCAFWIQ